MWSHVEAEGCLGLALLVGDDERVLTSVPSRALHHIEADLSVIRVSVVVRMGIVKVLVKKTTCAISDQKGNGSLMICQVSSSHHLFTCIHCTYFCTIVKWTLFPEAVIRCFIACSFTSFPSFIQATVAGGAFSVASNDAAAPRATVNELGKAVKIGA